MSTFPPNPKSSICPLGIAMEVPVAGSTRRMGGKWQGFINHRFPEKGISLHSSGSRGRIRKPQKSLRNSRQKGPLFGIQAIAGDSNHCREVLMCAWMCNVWSVVSRLMGLRVQCGVPCLPECGWAYGNHSGVQLRRMQSWWSMKPETVVGPEISSTCHGMRMPLTRCIHLHCRGDKVPGQQTDPWEIHIPPREEGGKGRRTSFNIQLPEFKSWIDPVLNQKWHRYRVEMESHELN